MYQNIHIIYHIFQTILVSLSVKAMLPVIGKGVVVSDTGGGHTAPA